PPDTDPLSLHDALPISRPGAGGGSGGRPRGRVGEAHGRDHGPPPAQVQADAPPQGAALTLPPAPGESYPRATAEPPPTAFFISRSEEHTSELQSRENLV